MKDFLKDINYQKKKKDNVNSLISIKEIESAFKNIHFAQSLPPHTHIHKIPEPDGFTGKLYQTLKEETYQFITNIYKIEEKGTLPNSFSEASITLIPKSEKDITRKKY